MAKRLDRPRNSTCWSARSHGICTRATGPACHYITYPWSNERRIARTLTEHLYSPVRLPLSRIDVFNTLMAPLVNPLVAGHPHEDDARLHRARTAISPLARAYRQMNYPRSARAADAIIINSESLRVGDPAVPGRRRRASCELIHEAVDHDLFKPGDAGEARARSSPHGVTKPFVLFVSSLWPYKNCDGLLRAWALARG